MTCPFLTQLYSRVQRQVMPVCGDGLDFMVLYMPAGQGKPKILAQQGYDANPKAQPNRQKLEWRLPVHVGDTIDFVLDPRTNHDCDGLYLVNMQIWPDDPLAVTMQP